MSEPRTEFSRTSADGTVAGANEAGEPQAVEVPPVEADSNTGDIEASPPSTPRWVKALGIVLVVLLLAFAGLHLTGNVPVHMAGEQGTAPHGIQLP
jgi:hypothetical protein